MLHVLVMPQNHAFHILAKSTQNDWLEAVLCIGDKTHTLLYSKWKHCSAQDVFFLRQVVCIILLRLLEVSKETSKHNLQLTGSLYRWHIIHLFPFVLVQTRLFTRFLWNSIVLFQLWLLDLEIFCFSWFPSLTSHKQGKETNK